MKINHLLGSDTQTLNLTIAENQGFQKVGGTYNLGVGDATVEISANTRIRFSAAKFVYVGESETLPSAEVTSTLYSVDNVASTISGISPFTTAETFLSNITAPEGATVTLKKGDITLSSTDLVTAGCTLVCVNDPLSKTYTLSLSEDYVSSTLYSIDQEGANISGVSPGTSVATFLSNLTAPAGATMTVYQGTEVVDDTANISSGYTLVVATSGYSVTYTIYIAVPKVDDIIICAQNNSGSIPGFTETSGTWYTSTNDTGIHYFNPSANTTLGRFGYSATATITAQITQPGYYEFYYYVSGHTADSSSVTANIAHSDGTDTQTFALNIPANQGFQKIGGEYYFPAGNATITISATGQLRFSAAKFVHAGGISSSTYNINNNECAISGINAYTTVAQLKENITAQTGVTLSVKNGETTLTDSDVVENGCILYAEKSGYSKAYILMVSPPAISSSVYTISSGSITGVAAFTTVSAFLDNITPASGVTLAVKDGNIPLTSDEIVKTGHTLVATTESGEVLYTITAEEAVTSTVYQIDHGQKKISSVAPGTTVQTFKSNILAADGATVDVKNGNTSMADTDVILSGNILTITKNNITVSYTIFIQVETVDPFILSAQDTSGTIPGFTELTGSWYSSQTATGIHYINPETGISLGRISSSNSTAKIEATIPQAGYYEFYYYTSGIAADTNNLVLTIHHADGTDTQSIDLRSSQGFAKVGGDYYFPAGTATIDLSSTGQIRFSAVKFVHAGGISSESYLIDNEGSMLTNVDAYSTVAGVKANISAPTGVTLSILDGTTVLADTDSVATGNILVASRDGNEKKYIIVVDPPAITSTVYSIDYALRQISGVESFTTVADFKNNLVPAEGVILTVKHGDTVLSDTDTLLNGDTVTALQNGRTKTYTISVTNPIIRSYAYAINHVDKIISHVSPNTTAGFFKSNIIPGDGVTIAIRSGETQLDDTAILSNGDTLVAVKDAIETVYTIFIPVESAASILICAQDTSGTIPGFTELTGSWYTSNNDTGLHYHNPDANTTLGRYTAEGGSATITADIQQAGLYELYYYISGHPADSAAVTVVINHAGGSDTQVIDLTVAANQGFQKVGTSYQFPVGQATVTISSDSRIRFSAASFVVAGGVSSAVYEIDNVASSVTNVESGTLVSVLKSNLTTVAGYSVFVERGNQILSDSDTVKTGDKLVCLSSDNVRKTYIITVNAAKISSDVYEIINQPATIKNVGPGTTVADFKANFTLADGITISVKNGDIVVSDTQQVENGYTLVMTQGDVETSYTISVEDIASDLYTINYSQKTIKLVPAGTTVADFLAQIDKQNNVTLTVKSGNTVKAGTDIIVSNDTLTVTKDSVETVYSITAMELLGAADGNITRAEFAAIMAYQLGYQLTPYAGQFADVSAQDWFADAVAVMSEKGIIEGFDGLFKPYDPITHEEAVKMMVVSYEIACGPTVPGAYATIFDDYFSISKWARRYINSGVMLGFAQGFGSALVFDPQGYISRTEVDTMIAPVVEAIEITNQFGGTNK